tara:strand:+ start:239 stop:1546 length:1308 start_codon:yes stop_codon:yes gene_type:complete
MADNKTQDTTVEQVDINIDELFAAAPDADAIVTPETKPKNIFSKSEGVDMSFTEKKEEPKAEEPAVEEPKVEEPKQEEEKVEEPKAKEDKKEEKEKETATLDDVLDSIDEEPTEEETKKRGRKKIEGIADVFEKLIKSEKIVPFDDDKPLAEYSAKDWEELIDANLEEKANQVRQETPAKFFESLPDELKIAARYVFDGGKDLKGLFQTLAQVEETSTIDVKSERGQERVIQEYLSATGYGTAEEIAEEIEVWKDLGKLEQQALKFQPKLQKMQEKVVASKLKEQDLKKKQQEQASKDYMENVYNTLKDGALNDIKIDKKTQSMLYNGLVQPNYPSVSGRNTNLLGHLLEKYQFVEPNYALISEALWLLQDPDGYKSKIMEKGAQKTIEKTVRKLKTEQVNSGGSSLGVEQKEDSTGKRTSRKKLPRQQNIFKRF